MDPAYTAVHIEEDRQHWWFRGRLAVIRTVLRQALPPRPVRLLEVGCGTGNVLAALGEFGEAVGVEAHPDLRAVAIAAGLDVRPGTLPDDLPIEPGWADVVLLLDVLEHLDDDAAALAAARVLLRAGGLLVATVPAYGWLWSAHDVALGHRRRYTARRLSRVVTGAGFGVARVTYFSTLLFPAMAAVRLAKRLAGDVAHDLHRPPATVNRILETVFAFERHLLGAVDLPFGSSVLLIARR